MSTVFAADYKQHPKILRLNVSGEPVEWLNWQDAACLYARTLVAWTLGDVILKLRGGHNRLTARQTMLSIHSIIACKGQINARSRRSLLPLTNKALFNRDNKMCLYCGSELSIFYLTRDHVTPKSRGGRDTWMNCVTACRRCNHRKGRRMPEEASMQLLALPYQPNNAEYLALINSGRILGDQMEFLQTRFSKNNRILLNPVSAV